MPNYVPSNTWTLQLVALIAAVVCAGGASLCAASPFESNSADDLTRLSLSDLANVEVTSVSKSSQSLQRAAASIFVITHDDIERSSATNVFEALRLAPNLLITQVSATSYTVASRGFGGNPTSQNFANKLLILVDGRSVYTPLYSGIYSFALDLMLEDVDRIEVISGPGATLWGANAMNGVINIITRAANLTTGTLVDAAAGNNEQTVATRYGGSAGEGAAFRIYADGFQRAAMELAPGRSAGDRWTKGQAGFRYDWSNEWDRFTIQGDAYRATEHQLASQDGLALGGNLVARFEHDGDRSNLKIQAYYDQSEQEAPGSGGGFVLNTYDIEVQQSFALGTRNLLIVGGGERLNDYSITNATSLLFEPSSRNLTLGNIFAQDTLHLGAALDLILGFKMEDDPYAGWSPLPDVRVSWQVNDKTTFWAAASRAIRSPTPFDADVVEKIGPTVFLTGNPQFRPENLWAYEAGTRVQASSSLLLTMAAFYDDYNNLKTVEPASATVFLPLQWGNLMQGHTFGIEAWASWQVNDWWRLSPSFTWLGERLAFKAGASGLLGIAQAADDPSSHAALTSSMDLSRRLTIDATVRYIGALPNPALRSYYEADLRCGWRISPVWDFSISGQNLLHKEHLEFATPNGEYITRSVLAESRWRF
jgi:iron complex outermembrane receptor protein